MSDQEDVTVDRPQQKPGGRFGDIQSRFFKVDLEAFQAACELGVNAASTYLVLACGTGADHKTTSWSAKAVEDRAGIKGTDAKKSIRSLAQAGLLQVLKDGTRPQYALVASQGAEEAGRVAWLPQSFIGTKPERGDPPNPLRFFKRQKDVELLQAMVSIYGSTNMDLTCGVDWRVSSNPSAIYKKRQITETRHYIVHGFSSPRWRQSHVAAPVLNRLLEARHIVMVPHLIDHDGADADVIMPMGVASFGALDWERAILGHINRATEALLQKRSEVIADDEIVIPFPKHFPDVELAGIVRPFLLPRTVPTLKWDEKRDEWLDAARRIGDLDQRWTF